eukprot:TRINITY_DN36479_c0_g2_i1.p1 TRINITY_DN36479_c0_g2~~TRINITY_DN36479_c0_g2_i1.p1  ORF type:complete len:624 (+),score=127.14 TRINITY_DN36479_c0_g2_i1:25-1872(+)
MPWLSRAEPNGKVRTLSDFVAPLPSLSSLPREVSEQEPPGHEVRHAERTLSDFMAPLPDLPSLPREEVPRKEVPEQDVWHECEDAPRSRSREPATSQGHQPATASTAGRPSSRSPAWIAALTSPPAAGRPSSRSVASRQSNVRAEQTTSVPVVAVTAPGDGSGKASQLGSGFRAQGSGRAPASPRDFVRCWGGAENSPPASSPARRRPSLEGFRPETMVDVDGLRQSLSASMSSIEKLPPHRQDLDTEAFRDMSRALTRAASNFRHVTAETILGSLEPKGVVLDFVIRLHMSKRQYRRQTSASIAQLLESDSWLYALLSDAGLLAKMPEDLREIIPKRQPAAPALVQTPPSSVSPTRAAAVAADAEELSEMRRRRATRRPERGSRELLSAARAQIEALGFSAEGEQDEVTLAFQTFGRAVRQSFAESSEADNGLKYLERFEPKAKVLDFLTDVSEKRRPYRARAGDLLTRLAALPSWKEAGARLPSSKDTQDDDEAEKEKTKDMEEPEAAVAASQSEPVAASEPEEERPPSRAKEDAMSRLEELARPLAPWYLRLCFGIFGVIGALRKCRCLVPRSLQQQAEPLLDAALGEVSAKLPSASEKSEAEVVQPSASVH